MHPRVSHTGIEAPAKLAVSGCSSDIMCAVTPTPEGGSVLAYDRHPKTGTLADLHRWLSHEGDPLYIRMPYANGCIYPQGAALLAYGALLHGSTKSWCFSGAGLCAHHVLGSVLADHLALSQHHHHHTLHQFDVFSGRNLCAHRVLVHQDIRLMRLGRTWGYTLTHQQHHQYHQCGDFSGRACVLIMPLDGSWHQDICLRPPSDRNHHTSTIIVGFCSGRCEAVHACIRID
ncbi:hypothetical protein PAPYR_8840 [Paratrimastix pyriformis]|uniref:Uncharacterized protein n=1 Tax=Paratrimastix pyriformis TaxID=342808 RepID=A0ABQ8U9T6_9EUKA|nr:hypothetical protein PAPYR_8840 [Paratrimastix pyriformis]